MVESPFAIRYPKVNFTGLNSAVSATSGAGFAGAVILNRDLGIVVAPARYSALRKITFFFHARYNSSATTRTYEPMVGYAATSSLDDTPLTYSVAKGTIVNAPTDQAMFTFSAGSGNRIFTARGSGVPVVFNGSIATNNRTYLFALEFNVANPSHSDFWSLWNAVAAVGDPDAYMMFYVGLDSLGTASAGDTGSLVIFSSGMAIVQAPTHVNKTCTTLILPGFGGETTGYAQNFSTSGTDAPPFLWQYNANEWDQVTSINALTIGRTTVSDGSQTLQFRLTEVGPSYVAGTPQSLNPTNGSTGRGFLARSSDFFTQLIDGATYCLEWKRGSGQALNNIVSWIEIIQNNFSLTTTYHDSSAMVSKSFNDAGTTFSDVDDYGEHTSSYFDPTWYRNSVVNMTKHRVYGAIQHKSAGNDPRQIVVIDPDLQGDNNQLASTTDLEVPPDLQSTPSGTVGLKIRHDAITGHDPVMRNGTHRLEWAKSKNHIWNAGANDIAGHMGLYYTFTVPNTEVPELGPLFDTGAFAPEGCAATAAGLGDPGILAITNGSVPPVKFNPAAETIEELGIPTPYEMEAPTVTEDAVLRSPAGQGLTNGTYIYRYTLLNCCTGKESDPNPDDVRFTVTAGGGGLAGQVTLSFAGVVIPGDPQVCKICVYRTVNGGIFPVMAKVGCFDPNVTTLFVDDLSDAQLDFVNHGLSILNSPPPCAPIVVGFRNRLFMMGDIPNLAPAGTVSAVNGSKYIEGSYTVEWDRCLEGKFIQLRGDCRSYEIERILPPSLGISPPVKRLKLLEAYAGTTQTGSLYTICGHANRVWFSEPLEPEYWPVVNVIDVEPGDGDRIIAGCANFDRLVICKRNKTYVLAFSETPSEVNVPARVSSDIGAIGPRTFAQIEAGTVWLADRGLAIYDGRGVQHVPASNLMKGIFTDPSNPRYVRRDPNGRVIDAVGVFYPKHEQYLLLLPTVQTDRGCNLLLVWDVKLDNITLHEFCQQFQSMVVAKDSDGNQRVYVGDTNGFVWVLDIGYTDGIGTPGNTGTVKGTITSGGFDSSGAAFIEDSGATFVEGGLPGFAGLSGLAGFSGSLAGGDLGMCGACLYVRPNAASPWTQRTIFAASQTRVYVTPGWPSGLIPAAGWEYMLGPIDFEARFKPLNYGTDDDTKRLWGIVLTHEPEAFSSKLRVQLIPDFQAEDPAEGTVTDDLGQTTERLFDLSFFRGKQVFPVGRDVHTYMQVVVSNFAPEEPVRMINLALRTEARASK